MRALKVLLAAGIASSVNAVGLEAPVYYFNRDSNSSSGRFPAASVEPSAARLLLAHRLDLSQYHSLGNVDDSTLQLLNRFGGANPPLFSEDEDVTQREKLLVVVEGVDKPDRMRLLSRLTPRARGLRDAQSSSMIGKRHLLRY